jgi:hypothetical protein
MAVVVVFHWESEEWFGWRKGRIERSFFQKSGASDGPFKWTTLLSPTNPLFGAVIMHPVRGEWYGVKFYRNAGRPREKLRVGKDPIAPLTFAGA